MALRRTRRGIAIAEFDVVINDGMVIDGTRMPRYRADLGIKNGRIAKIGRLRSSYAAKTVTPRVRSSRQDSSICTLITTRNFSGTATPFCTISSWHGVTSIVIGNCGFAPVRLEDRGPIAWLDSCRHRGLRV